MMENKKDIAYIVYICTAIQIMGYWPSVRSRWLDIGQVLLLRVYGLRQSWGLHV